MSLFRRSSTAKTKPALAIGGENGTPFTLAVVNPGGRDPEQHFPAGAGQPEAPGVPHPPINFHAYAACTGGSFHTQVNTALLTGRPVLLLLRRDLAAALRALRRIKKFGRPVAVAFKETGSAQLAARLTQGADLKTLAAIVDLADGCLAPVPWMVDFLVSLRSTPPAEREGTAAFVPTPYPVDDGRWNLSIPPAQRHGIFVGTREFATPSRQHLRALLAARQLHRTTGEPVTVLNPEGGAAAKALAALGFSTRPDSPLRIVPGSLPYVEYLRVMARHRIVFQLDRSGVPGQVAGDALLCRVPCVGGDGAIEQVAFPEWNGLRREADELTALAATLLASPESYAQAWRDAQARAVQELSFRRIADRLLHFYRTLVAAGARRAS